MSSSEQEKPSLEELEEILNAAEEVPIEILPNGEVRAKRKGSCSPCSGLRSKPFPLQGEQLRDDPRKRLPGTHTSWPLAELAYSAYARCFGGDQSLERLAERGGFSISELAFFLLDACGYQVDILRGTVSPPEDPQ